MKTTIINSMTISEVTMSPVINAIIYDHEMCKFLRKNSKISRESLLSGNVNEVIDNIKDYEIISDDEIIKMYYGWIDSGQVSMWKRSPLSPVDTNSIEFKLVENYVKSLNREEKLNNLGLE